MKKLFTALSAIFIFTAMLVPVYADGITAVQLFSQWEESSYPDYVTGAFYNTETGSLSFLLTENTPQRQAAINAMITDADKVTYYASKYSHAQLEEVRAAIAQEVSAAGGNANGVVGIGVGWGVNGGFGESGKDFRVIAEVTTGAEAALTDRYAAEYGDMVVIETTDDLQAAQDSAAEKTEEQVNAANDKAEKKGLSDWGIIGIAAIILGGLVFGLNRFGKSKKRQNQQEQ